MESVAWKLKIPVDRVGGFLNYELRELGIDEFMAVQTFIDKQKWAEAFLLFLNATRIGGDEVSKLEAEFKKNNIVPFTYCLKTIPEILEPERGELKKS